MSRLIDADALIEAHYDYCNKHHGDSDVFYTWSLKLMKEAPTIDAVEVVRCRDCTYAVKSKRVEKSCFPVFCAILEARMKDDDYCSQGDKND